MFCTFVHTHIVNLVNGKLYCNILWRVAFVAAVMITNERIAPRCKQENDNWLHCIYTVLHMFRQVLFGAGNQGNHQNFEKSLLTNKL